VVQVARKLLPSITGEAGTMLQWPDSHRQEDGSWTPAALARLEEMATVLVGGTDRTPDPEVLVGDFFSSCSFHREAVTDRHKRRPGRKRWHLAI
jgi:hypothetical protein